ncbi:HEAT repeat domain-containing protein [Asanoa siamensis]|uniref:HEAT repeat domain-containing protein n=1 Tax=Asanoa siamensis TaxID=926357 RepID=UPI001944C6F8|nr:HEAT repeat domain-containing protein [Asanoa siamensis]
MTEQRRTVDAPPPRARVLAECARRGHTAVVDGCVALLEGAGDGDVQLIVVLGGPAASWALDPSEGGPGSSRWYWVRVWAARGLLWAWDPRATTAIVAALHDPAWRVRELAAKVVARHLVGDALAAVTVLRTDPVPRVRAAAHRAVVGLTAAGA